MSRLLSRRLHLQPAGRLFTTTTLRPAFSAGPAPPRLPPKEQEEFERLQRSSTGAFSTPRPQIPVFVDNTPPKSTTSRGTPQINQSPHSTSTTSSSIDIPPNPKSAAQEEILQARVAATGKGEELHPDIRRGAKPEFEGDVNPKTGEVGGPKNEPLRWGSTGERGDWSYNGRVTDF